MPVLTTKELIGLQDQLDFEKVLCCKYRSAAQETVDQQLKTCFSELAEQHRQNYTSLLTHLH